MRLLGGLACMGALFAPAPSLAAGRAEHVAATQVYLHASKAENAAATQAFLRAIKVYAHGASAEVGARVATIAARANEIAGECPSALTYAPRDAAFGEIGEEVRTTLSYAGVAPMRVRRLRFARAIGRLRWSDRRLTRFVRAQAAEEVAVVAVALPDVCADIQAWRGSAYAALPQSAMGFLARTAALESRSYVGLSEETRERAIMRLLRPYEGPRERRTVKRIGRQEQRTDRKLGMAAEAAQARLAAALGVSKL
jgi:hypothetical protein